MFFNEKLFYEKVYTGLFSIEGRITPSKDVCDFMGFFGFLLGFFSVIYPSANIK